MFSREKNDWSMQNVVKLALTSYSTATKHDFEVYEKILMYKMFHWYVDCQESPFCFFSNIYKLGIKINGDQMTLILNHR